MSKTKTMLAAVLMLVSAAFAEEQPPRGPHQVITQAEETVMFNTKTHKYHCATCDAAARCTAHCIPLAKTEAIRRGGIPCRRCGGSCRP